MSECTKNLNQIVTYLNELKVLWHEPNVRKEWKKIKSKTPLYKIRKYLLKHKGRDIIKKIITLYDDIKDNYECKQIINTKINQLIDYKNRLTTALLTILESDRQLILNELSRIDKYNYGKSQKTINLMNYFEPLKTKKILTNNSKSDTKNVVQPKIIKETEIIRNTSQPPEKLNSALESKKSDVLVKDSPRNKLNNAERRKRDDEERRRREKEAREEKLRKEKEAREDKLRKQKEDAERKRQEREDRLRRERNEAADRRRREQNSRRDRSDFRSYGKKYDRGDNGRSKSDRRDNAYDKARVLRLEREAAMQRERDRRREQDKIRICNELKLKIIRNNTNTTEADIEEAKKNKEEAQTKVNEIVKKLKTENNPDTNKKIDELSSNDAIQKLITDLIKKLETAIAAGAIGPGTGDAATAGAAGAAGDDDSSNDDDEEEEEEENSKLKHDECNDGSVDPSPSAAPAGAPSAAPAPATAPSADANQSNLDHDECNDGSSATAASATASDTNSNLDHDECNDGSSASAASATDTNSNLIHDECNNDSFASAGAADATAATATNSNLIHDECNADATATATDTNSNLIHDECNGASRTGQGGGGTKNYNCTQAKFSDNLYLSNEPSLKPNTSEIEYECTLIAGGQTDKINKLKPDKSDGSINNIRQLIKTQFKYKFESEVEYSNPISIIQNENNWTINEGEDTDPFVFKFDDKLDDKFKEDIEKSNENFMYHLRASLFQKECYNKSNEDSTCITQDMFKSDRNPTCYVGQHETEQQTIRFASTLKSEKSDLKKQLLKAGEDTASEKMKQSIKKLNNEKAIMGAPTNTWQKSANYDIEEGPDVNTLIQNIEEAKTKYKVLKVAEKILPAPPAPAPAPAPAAPAPAAPEPAPAAPTPKPPTIDAFKAAATQMSIEELKKSILEMFQGILVQYGNNIIQQIPESAELKEAKEKLDDAELRYNEAIKNKRVEPTDEEKLLFEECFSGRSESEINATTPISINSDQDTSDPVGNKGEKIVEKYLKVRFFTKEELGKSYWSGKTWTQRFKSTVSFGLASDVGTGLTQGLWGFTDITLKCPHKEKCLGKKSEVNNLISRELEIDTIIGRKDLVSKGDRLINIEGIGINFIPYNHTKCFGKKGSNGYRISNGIDNQAHFDKYISDNISAALLKKTEYNVTKEGIIKCSVLTKNYDNSGKEEPEKTAFGNITNSNELRTAIEIIEKQENYKRPKSQNESKLWWMGKSAEYIINILLSELPKDYINYRGPDDTDLNSTKKYEHMRWEYRTKDKTNQTIWTCGGIRDCNNPESYEKIKNAVLSFFHDGSELSNMNLGSEKNGRLINLVRNKFNQKRVAPKDIVEKRGGLNTILNEIKIEYNQKPEQGNWWKGKSAKYIASKLLEELFKRSKRSKQNSLDKNQTINQWEVYADKDPKVSKLIKLYVTNVSAATAEAAETGSTVAKEAAVPEESTVAEEGSYILKGGSEAAAKEAEPGSTVAKEAAKGEVAKGEVANEAAKEAASKEAAAKEAEPAADEIDGTIESNLRNDIYSDIINLEKYSDPDPGGDDAFTCSNIKKCNDIESFNKIIDGIINFYYSPVPVKKDTMFILIRREWGVHSGMLWNEKKIKLEKVLTEYEGEFQSSKSANWWNGKPAKEIVELYINKLVNDPLYNIWPISQIIEYQYKSPSFYTCTSKTTRGCNDLANFQKIRKGIIDFYYNPPINTRDKMKSTDANIFSLIMNTYYTKLNMEIPKSHEVSSGEQLVNIWQDSNTSLITKGYRLIEFIDDDFQKDFIDPNESTSKINRDKLNKNKFFFIENVNREQTPLIIPSKTQLVSEAEQILLYFFDKLWNCSKDLNQDIMINAKTALIKLFEIQKEKHKYLNTSKMKDHDEYEVYGTDSKYKINKACGDDNNKCTIDDYNNLVIGIQEFFYKPKPVFKEKFIRTDKLYRRYNLIRKTFFKFMDNIYEKNIVQIPGDIVPKIKDDANGKRFDEFMNMIDKIMVSINFKSIKTTKTTKTTKFWWDNKDTKDVVDTLISNIFNFLFQQKKDESGYMNLINNTLNDPASKVLKKIKINILLKLINIKTKDVTLNSNLKRPKSFIFVNKEINNNNIPKIINLENYKKIQEYIRMFYYDEGNSLEIINKIQSEHEWIIHCILDSLFNKYGYYKTNANSDYRYWEKTTYPAFKIISNEQFEDLDKTRVNIDGNENISLTIQYKKMFTHIDKTKFWLFSGLYEPESPLTNEVIEKICNRNITLKEKLNEIVNKLDNSYFLSIDYDLKELLISTETINLTKKLPEYINDALIGIMGPTKINSTIIGIFLSLLKLTKKVDKNMPKELDFSSFDNWEMLIRKKYNYTYTDHRDIINITNSDDDQNLVINKNDLINFSYLINNGVKHEDIYHFMVLQNYEKYEKSEKSEKSENSETYKIYNNEITDGFEFEYIAFYIAYTNVIMKNPIHKELIYNLKPNDIKILESILQNKFIEDGADGKGGKYVYDHKKKNLIEISDEPGKKAIHDALGNHIKIFKIENININLI